MIATSGMKLLNSFPVRRNIMKQASQILRMVKKVKHVTGRGHFRRPSGEQQYRYLANNSEEIAAATVAVVAGKKTK